MAEQSTEPQDDALSPTQFLCPTAKHAALNVPVTPDIFPGADKPSPSSSSSSGVPVASYFAHELQQQDDEPAPATVDASQETVHRTLSASLDTIDPRATNPSLGLTGNVISATFCIPHTLQYTKGSEWVSETPSRYNRLTILIIS